MSLCWQLEHGEPRSQRSLLIVHRSHGGGLGTPADCLDGRQRLALWRRFEHVCMVRDDSMVIKCSFLALGSNSRDLVGDLPVWGGLAIQGDRLTLYMSEKRREHRCQKGLDRDFAKALTSCEAGVGIGFGHRANHEHLASTGLFLVWIKPMACQWTDYQVGQCQTTTKP